MGKLKWFLGEFFVVVAGVLVAFILNSWWMSIKDANKEQTYLVQIYEDINSTIDQVKEAEEEQRAITHAASMLMALTYSTQLPPDSVISAYIWRSMAFAPTSRVSATLSSLVSTGDLQLIKNDSLRSVLGDLVSDLNAYTTTNDHMAFWWLIPAYERFADEVHVADFRFQSFNEKKYAQLAADSLRGFPDPIIIDMPERRDLHEMIKHKDFRQNLLKLHIAQLNFWRLHKDFHNELLKTREMLIREMEAEAVEYMPRESDTVPPQSVSN